jgi:hypothetical protein
VSRLVLWLRRHRLPRIALVLGTFLLPLTNVVSAALVVMTARAEHWRSAAVDVLVAIAALGALLAYTSDVGGQASPTPAILGAAALWGGSLLAGALLGRYRSVDLTLQVLVIAVAVGVLGATVAVPDARAYWEPILKGLIEAAGLPVAGGLPAGWLGTVAALMHGVIGASLLSTLVLAVMLGLWLDRDGEGAEWRRRFLELRLGRVLSVATVLAVAALAAGLPALGGGLLLVLGTAFATQGLAIVHWTADERSWPRVWPLALYAPLLVGAPPAGLMLLLLALGGLADNFVALRRRRANVV